MLLDYVFGQFTLDGEVMIGKILFLITYGLCTVKYPRIISIRSVNNEKGKYEYRVETKKHKEVIYYYDTLPKGF